MSNRLENFIKRNKKDFDHLEPPANLWAGIERQLDEKKALHHKKERVIKLSLLLKVAAAVIIVFSAVLVLWRYQETQALNISNISPELSKQQVHYASLIETKQLELKRIEKEEPHLYREFSEEISKMEENYQKLKNDLPDSPNQEETVKAMIRNLQTQIEVLNQQLIIIKQINDLKDGKNETQSI